MTYRKQRKQNTGKSFLGSLFDIVIFQPHRSPDIQLWRDIYHSQRLARKLEQGINQHRRKGWL
jgi:hypothetical protein